MTCFTDLTDFFLLVSVSFTTHEISYLGLKSYSDTSWRAVNGKKANNIERNLLNFPWLHLR